MAAPLLPAADFPSAEIGNGRIRVKLYLPDWKNGFYRGTRFDGSGMIGSLEYEGHNYYGPWFSRVDARVHDFSYDGAGVVASPCSAATGPAEEFQTNGSALGWDEARAGGTFVKIGVGVLRKQGGPYDFARLYPVVDPGKWTVEKHPDSIVFTHELSDPATGYAYVYSKIVRLLKDHPAMRLEHTLRNTGRRAIQSTVYNHNFLVLDHQPPGPDFTITVPFSIQPAAKEFVETRGRTVVFRKTLTGGDVAQIPVGGFGPGAADNDIRIENTRVGAGMHITGDRPLTRESLWSIRTVLAMEPTIGMHIQPGGQFDWTISYEYYTTKPH